MPGLVVFGRRWGIASDDLVFPGAFELFLRLIWWIGMLVLYSMHKGKFECNGGGLLHSYLIVLIILLAAIILVLSSIIYVSMQGTITNPGPRRSIPALIYVRATLYVPELIWACLGAIWVSDNSLGCEPSIVNAVTGAVVASWIILFFTLVVVLIVFDPLGSKKTEQFAYYTEHNLESSQSAQLFYTAKSVATRVWENRIKLLCCCVMQDNDSRAAFTSVAQLFSDYFSDTDLVPSDIAAGLSLLHQEQDKVEQSRDSEVVVSHSPSSLMKEQLDIELENAAFYMQFAVAAYGWPMYVYSNPLTGVCKLGSDCCRSRTPEYDIVGGDNLGCHFSSMLQTTGLQYRDFIFISFHNQIYEIPFYVALVHKKETVLVSVRGTLSLKDVLTDLSADCEKLTIDGVPEGSFAHKGIIQAASYIYRKLVNDGILNQAFSIAPEYKLVITGHSLGAGTASILAILLKKSFPGLKCYAFSPPGGLLSKSLSDYSKDFIVSIVVGKDLVPRLSISNMEDLKKRVLRMVVNCNKPKYQILLRGCWYEFFGGDPDDFPTELEGRKQEDLTRPLLGEQSLLGHRSSSYSSLLEESPSLSPQHLPLYPPGRIIHIIEESSTGRFCFTQVKYTAMWSKETAFSSVFISPRMIKDHMPDVVFKALVSLTQDAPFILCPTPRDATSNPLEV
ncbi:diacylglycerol lipase-beta [Latimeria chalumnae]|uniref:Diacylglycerol lipase-beta n=1 Tax=Latimeria chalumnae TaxID=7897 RepID=H3B0N7_LATCH|nr:PREDICTED: sn1-specific diacylglycerol lipase beta [Latimeria chalumnae]|eukprot:XP_005998437.1 PREDICTED: sn1-specific diacylglycerol lipase beta [Latimeria chalumnae]